MLGLHSARFLNIYVTVGKNGQQTDLAEASLQKNVRKRQKAAILLSRVTEIWITETPYL